MKGFIAGLVAGVTVGGGAIVAAGLPNPSVGECDWVDFVVDHGDATYMDPDGPVTGAHGWQVCGYQVPTGDGSAMRAVDEEFYFELDHDTAVMVAAASRELTEP